MSKDQSKVIEIEQLFGEDNVKVLLQKVQSLSTGLKGNWYKGALLFGSYLFKELN